MSQSVLLILIAAFAVLFPQDFIIAVELIWLRSKALCLNANLLIRSYVLYRKLRADIVKAGYPPPPFRFTPVQDRL